MVLLLCGKTMYIMKKVNELIVKKNEIEAQIASIESGITSENEVVLISEILNLLDGVGEGFVQGDYYAQDRYYSKLNGVKNIRIIGHEIYAKITTPSGYLIPSSLLIRDVKYRIMTVKSDHFSAEIDY